MNTTLQANSEEYYKLLSLRDQCNRGTTRYVALTQDLKRNKLERKILKRIATLKLDPFDEQRYLEYARKARNLETLQAVYIRLAAITRREYQEYQQLRVINPDVAQAAKDILNIQ